MNSLDATNVLPRGACDCHAHVFGPFAQFPLAPQQTYVPPEATAEDYIAVLKSMGFERGVLVQPSAHGLDNRAMLSALSQHAGSPHGISFRGVGVADSSITDSELESWHEKGVRALRFRHAPSTGGVTHFVNTVGLDQFLLLAPRMRELGWHAQLWTHASCWDDIEEDVLGTGLPIVIDHMARVDPVADIDTKPYQNLMQALKRGDVWVKMTAYRNTTDFPAMKDLDAVMEAFVDCNPDRLIWGSDWPHIHFSHAVDTGKLLEHFLGYVGDREHLKRMLVDNPARLYGFEAGSAG